MFKLLAFGNELIEKIKFLVVSVFFANFYDDNVLFKL